MASIPLLVGFALVGTAIVWVGSGVLEDAADKLASYYQLPPVVQGAIIAAIGSSFPELSSAVLATYLHGEFELGVAAIVGSAVFNILVIPGLSGLSGSETLSATRDIVYKEAQFYMLSVAVLLVTFSFAVIYNPAEGAGISGEMTRALAVIPLAVYGLYLFIQQQDTADHVPTEDAPDVNVLRRWLSLVAALALILVGVEILVQAAIRLGDAFGTPSFLWGLTVIAAGTSLPDALISIRAARAGQSSVSMANVFGSNIFDLLVAVPAGVLVAGVTPVNFSRAAPMMAILVFATVVLFASLRTDLELSRRESYGLLVLYAGFVAWMAMESTGLTGFIL